MQPLHSKVRLHEQEDWLILRVESESMQCTSLTLISKGPLHHAKDRLSEMLVQLAPVNWYRTWTALEHHAAADSEGAWNSIPVPGA